MLPAILASVGLPLLVKAVSAGVGAIDHPVARTAAAALNELDAAVGSGGIAPEQLAESNRHIERLAALDTEEAVAALRQVNATIRTEARTDDAFVRRWRPTFGYVVALAWGVQMAAVSWAIVAEPRAVAAILDGMASLSVMWGIALSVLGVAVHQRSKDKAATALAARLLP